jgi:hypothetical protein
MTHAAAMRSAANRLLAVAVALLLIQVVLPAAIAIQATTH